VNEQARANGLMWGSKTIGTSVSLVIGNWLINHYGFSTAILSLSLAVCVIMLVPLLLRERPGEKLLPWTTGTIHPHSEEVQLDSWSHIFISLKHVFFLPGSILMGIAVYFIHIAIGLMDTLLPVFTIQGAGWTDTEYSRVFSVCNIIAGFLGMIAGGALADFFGKKRMMTIYLISIIVLVGVMALAKAWWHTSFVIAGFIGIYYTLYVFLTIVIFATAMELSWKRVAATQFTAFMAIANIGRATGSGILGPMRTAMPWEYVIASIAAFAVAMLILIQLLKLKKHVAKLVVLESDYLLHEKEEQLFKQNHLL
jgi:MFS transporter, PAT family, beta-lactamase induction signal transducer AmpG